VEGIILVLYVVFEDSRASHPCRARANGAST
jgi:hypothetical protein